MGRQQVLWNRIFIFLETCNLWVNKKYDWKEQFKGWRFSMILVRCWCTVWIAFGAFSVGKTTSIPDIYRVVKQYNLFVSGPYSSVPRKLLLTTAWSFLSFGWNLICVFAHGFLPWHLVLGVFDIIIAIVLGGAQAELYTFIPQSNQTCQGNITAWNRPADDSPSLFEIYGNFTGQTPQKACSQVLGASYWQIVILAHEAFVAFMTMTYLLPVGHAFHFRSLFLTVIRILSLPLREPFYLLHYLYRSNQGRKQRSKASKEVELRYLEKKKVVYTGRFSTRFEQVLALEECLLVIASRLHYYEVRRLGQVSKSIHELVFPHMDLPMRTAKLRQATKCRSSDAKCWNCNLPMCVREDSFVTSVCGNQGERWGMFGRHLSDPMERHRCSCQPHCSYCYYMKMRSWGRQKRRLCICSFNGAVAVLCPDCVLLDDATSIRVGFTREIVRKQAMLARECEECHASLGKKVWWICGTCNKTCGDEVHAVERQKIHRGNDVETDGEVGKPIKEENLK